MITPKSKKKIATPKKERSNTLWKNKQDITFNHKKVEREVLDKREGKPTGVKGKKANLSFPLPEVGDNFVINGQEWVVLSINYPVVGYARIKVKGKEVIIWFFELWEKIDHNISYIKDVNTRTKYDWESIKQEFFESEFLDVAPFMVKKFWRNIADGWKHAEKTKWWWDEKRKIRQEAKRKAQDEFKSNLKERWDAVFDKLEMAHVEWLADLADRILDQWQVDKRKVIRDIRDSNTNEVIGTEVEEEEYVREKLPVDTLIKSITHIKLEKWEPTNITDPNGKSHARAWLDDLNGQKEKTKESKTK